MSNSQTKSTKFGPQPDGQPCTHNSTRLTNDEVDELRRGKLQEGVAELDGGRAQPHGAEGADEGGQHRQRPPLAEGDPPVARVLLVPVTLPHRHDPCTPTIATDVPTGTNLDLK